MIGHALMNFVAAGDPFELAWGADPDVYVHREKTRSKPEASMFGSSDTSEHFVTVRLSNLGEQPKRFTLRERIPVSEIEKVEIEPLKEEIEPHATPDDNGFLQWDVELPAFTQKTVRVAYSVKRHSDIVGLEL